MMQQHAETKDNVPGTMPELKPSERQAIAEHPAATDFLDSAEQAKLGSRTHQDSLERAAAVIDQAEPGLAYRLRAHAAEAAFDALGDEESCDREQSRTEISRQLLRARSELRAAQEARRLGIRPTLTQTKIPRGWTEPGTPALRNVAGSIAYDGECTRTEQVDWILKHGYEIPTERTLALIARTGMPVLELGAGAGNYAAELRAVGVDVAATDPQADRRLRPPDRTRVERLDAVDAVRKHPGRALMLIWPEAASEWSGQALELYHRQGGDTVIFQGEQTGDMTGGARFHHLLETRFYLEFEIEPPHFRTDRSTFSIWRKAAQLQQYEYNGVTAGGLAGEGLFGKDAASLSVTKSLEGIREIATKMASNLEQAYAYALGARGHGADSEEQDSEESGRWTTAVAAAAAEACMIRLMDRERPEAQRWEITGEFSRECYRLAPQLRPGDRDRTTQRLTEYLTERRATAEQRLRQAAPKRDYGTVPAPTSVP